jgi:hypothetical protein
LHCVETSSSVGTLICMHSTCNRDELSAARAALRTVQDTCAGNVSLLRSDLSTASGEANSLRAALKEVEAHKKAVDRQLKVDMARRVRVIISAHTHICACAYMRVCMHVCDDARMWTYIYVSECTDTCGWMHLCVCVCMYVCVCMQTTFL